MLYRARSVVGIFSNAQECWAVVFVLKGCSSLLQRLVFVLRALCYLLCDVRRC